MAATSTSSPQLNGVAVVAVPTLRRRRPSRLLLLGIVLAVLGALLGVYLYVTADNRTAVVAVARPVAYGQMIASDDLREVLLPPDTGLATVAWDEVDRVIGRRAGTDLRPGQTVTPDAVTGVVVPPAGEAVVGLPVAAGQLPVTPLIARDNVLVVGGKDAVGGSAGEPVRAVVLDVGDVDVSGHRTVDLLVPEGDAVTVARDAAAGGSVLVLVARG